MAEQPQIAPFSYLRIPSDDKEPVSALQFAGHSDEELRDTIASYFRRNSLTRAQREEMTSHVLQQAEEQKKKGEAAAASAAAKASRVTDVTEAEPTTTNDNNNSVGTTPSLEEHNDTDANRPSNRHLAEDFIDHSSFEIVPVVMPKRDSGFIGTSLYIDDAGRFKDLPLNSRASRLTQRDIRGDAFLLSNHDDPAQDVWARVDCPMSRYQQLHDAPPSTSYDSSDKAQMAAETVLRDQESKAISAEDAAAGVQAKQDGNKFFQSGDALAAIQAYSTAIELLSGRRDLHDNAAELDLTVEQSFLNRSMCYGKVNKWNESAKDAQTAVALNPGNGKGYFRLATARAQLQDFKAALDALAACEMTLGGTTDDTRRLREEIGVKSAQQLAKQRATFGKMFQ